MWKKPVKKSNKTALVRAVDFLSVHDYTVYNLRKKLMRCGYTENEIDVAIEKLLKCGYLDDTALCHREWQRYLHNGNYSFLQIRQKLLQNGFAEDVIASLQPNREEQDRYEGALLEQMLQKKFLPDDDYQKICAYFYRKGFSSGLIRTAVEKFLKTLE